ncbi:hypothetical protein Bbelb_192880 [Branchiostoma belcheri]|nr:hypothetical protein Bbelb_192880 [Branchiostoma belcheri]
MAAGFQLLSWTSMHFNARVPSQIVWSTDGLAKEQEQEDGLVEKQEDDVQFKALEVVACAKEAEPPSKITNVILPDVCGVCSQCFANGERLANHKKKPMQLQGELPFGICIKAMKRDRLIAELTKLGKL